jgi:tetratricopeptide (TPR) repeat protein
MLKRNLLLAFLFLSPMLMGQKATITVESRDILTYPYSDPNPVPILAEGRNEIFPYFSFNGYSLKGQTQKWKVIKLENDYIEVYVLPSDGGKVWGAIEKSTGKEFIYRNEVMKYRNISMRGPWTSGGIEFNFGFIGHNPSTCVPVDYKTVENADGSVSCFVGSLDLSSRTKWSVEIRVPKDKAYFETRAMWSNPTSLPQTYYNWMTAAAVVTDDLEFSYPGNQEIGHGGEQGLWPVNRDGRNIAMYANNAWGSDRSAHIVGEYNDFMGGYYHKSNFGFGHWSLYDEMPGHKLWLWSQARNGAIWEDLLTDSDGQYMEFQAGRMFNQYGNTTAFKTPISQTPFTPGLTDKWTEIWFPVKEIGGLTDVSPMGVLSVKPEDGKLQIGINSLSFADAKVTVKSEGKVVFTEDKKFKPMDIYKTSVALNVNADYEVVVDGMDLQYCPSKRKLLNRPFVSSMPMDIVTPSSLYQEGMELKEERNYRHAKDLFNECLQKDPLHIDALAALTEIYYRSNQYDSALYFANKALQLDTYHPSANYFIGITYKAMGKMTDALESLGWAARSQEYRSTAYAIMAGIELQLENNDLAVHYANLSLDFNRTNFNALEVLAILYRKTKETGMADKYVETISSIDPLSHFADYERNLLHPSAENYARFTSSITNETPYQTYLELSMIYYGLGLKSDALQVLENAPVQAEITIWKAYLKDDVSLLSEAAAASPAYVFPYRAESVTALTWALSKNASWKFKYYLAMNYIAIQRDDDAMKLFEACGQEPDYAPFYLTRAALLVPKDDNKVLADLQTAHKLAPDDWRAANKLINYYDDHKNYQMTLTLSTEAYKKFKDKSDIGVQYAIALINNGQYAKSLKTLEVMNILPSEGSRYGKVIYEQASLFLALDLIKSKKYPEAMKMIEKSKEWPEHLGVGKPYEVETIIQDYLQVYCLDKMKRTGETVALRKSIVDHTNLNPQTRFNYVHYTLDSSTSFNNILSLKLLKDNGETDALNALVQKIEKSGSSGNLVNQWVIAVYNNDQAKTTELEKGFSKNTNFLILKKLLEVTSK